MKQFAYNNFYDNGFIFLRCFVFIMKVIRWILGIVFIPCVMRIYTGRWHLLIYVMVFHGIIRDLHMIWVKGYERLLTANICLCSCFVITFIVVFNITCILLILIYFTCLMFCTLNLNSAFTFCENLVFLFSLLLDTKSSNELKTTDL